MAKLCMRHSLNNFFSNGYSELNAARVLFKDMTDMVGVQFN